MTGRRIVLDANILVRAVLGRKVRPLIERYAEEVMFFVPALGFDEAERHPPTIAAKRNDDPQTLLESLERLRAIVATWTGEHVEIYLSGA